VSKKYAISEIFYSLQGEGVRAGTASVFVRFSGCNLRCTVATEGFDCDTDHSCNHVMSGREIAAECAKYMSEETPRWVVFTGGEPAMQLDADLVHIFRARGWHLAVETNGSLPLPEGLDWITVSPRRQAIQVLSGVSEVKCVVGAEGTLPDVGRLRPGYRLISPAFNGPDPDPAAIARCVQLVKENPKWRLSIQLHKFLHIQ